MTPERRAELRKMVSAGTGYVVRGLSEALDDNETLEQLFDLGHTRTVEADKLWQAAHPERPGVFPDQGELIAWLMERYDELKGTA